jgi:hypothetical protein
MAILPVVVPGDWYFMVTCPACQRQSPIGLAPSPQRAPIVTPWAEKVDCPCGDSREYRPEEIRRLVARNIERAEPSAAFHLPKHK